MKIQDQPYRSIWLKQDDPAVVQVIDQRYLPHRFCIADLRSVAEVVRAIRGRWWCAALP